MLPVDLAELLTGLANEEAPFEICGFILRDWRHLEITNMSTELSRFDMNEVELLDAHANYGNNLIGVYHSHPSGNRRPSTLDHKYAPSGMRYWIVTPTEVIEWDMNDDVPKEIGSTSSLASAVSKDHASIGSGDSQIA